MQAATGEEKVEGARWSAIWGYKTSSEWPVTKCLDSKGECENSPHCS